MNSMAPQRSVHEPEFSSSPCPKPKVDKRGRLFIPDSQISESSCSPSPPPSPSSVDRSETEPSSSIEKIDPSMRVPGVPLNSFLSSLPPTIRRASVDKPLSDRPTLLRSILKKTATPPSGLVIARTPQPLSRNGQAESEASFSPSTSEAAIFNNAASTPSTPLKRKVKPSRPIGKNKPKMRPSQPIGAARRKLEMVTERSSPQENKDTTEKKTELVQPKQDLVKIKREMMEDSIWSCEMESNGSEPVYAPTQTIIISKEGRNPSKPIVIHDLESEFAGSGSKEIPARKRQRTAEMDEKDDHNSIKDVTGSSPTTAIVVNESPEPEIFSTAPESTQVQHDKTTTPVCRRKKRRRSRANTTHIDGNFRTAEERRMAKEKSDLDAAGRGTRVEEEEDRSHLKMELKASVFSEGLKKADLAGKDVVEEEPSSQGYVTANSTQEPAAKDEEEAKPTTSENTPTLEVLEDIWDDESIMSVRSGTFVLAEQPWLCEKCPRRYRRFEHLSKHDMKRHQSTSTRETSGEAPRETPVEDPRGSGRCKRHRKRRRQRENDNGEGSSMNNRMVKTTEATALDGVNSQARAENLKNFGKEREKEPVDIDERNQREAPSTHPNQAPKEAGEYAGKGKEKQKEGQDKSKPEDVERAAIELLEIMSEVRRDEIENDDERVDKLSRPIADFGKVHSSDLADSGEDEDRTPSKPELSASQKEILIEQELREIEEQSLERCNYEKERDEEKRKEKHNRKMEKKLRIRDEKTRRIELVNREKRREKGAGRKSLLTKGEIDEEEEKQTPHDQKREADEEEEREQDQNALCYDESQLAGGGGDPDPDDSDDSDDSNKPDMHISDKESDTESISESEPKQNTPFEESSQQTSRDSQETEEDAEELQAITDRIERRRQNWHELKRHRAKFDRIRATQKAAERRRREMTGELSLYEQEFPHQCNICDLRVQTTSSLYRHFREKHKISIYTRNRPQIPRDSGGSSGKGSVPRDFVDDEDLEEEKYLWTRHGLKPKDYQPSGKRVTFETSSPISGVDGPHKYAIKTNLTKSILKRSSNVQTGIQGPLNPPVTAKEQGDSGYKVEDRQLKRKHKKSKKKLTLCSSTYTVPCEKILEVIPTKDTAAPINNTISVTCSPPCEEEAATQETIEPNSIIVVGSRNRSEERLECERLLTESRRVARAVALAAGKPKYNYLGDDISNLYSFTHDCESQRPKPKHPPGVEKPAYAFRTDDIHQPFRLEDLYDQAAEAASLGYCVRQMEIDLRSHVMDNPDWYVYQMLGDAQIRFDRKEGRETSIHPIGGKEAVEFTPPHVQDRYDAAEERVEEIRAKLRMVLDIAVRFKRMNRKMRNKLQELGEDVNVDGQTSSDEAIPDKECLSAKEPCSSVL